MLSIDHVGARGERAAATIGRVLALALVITPALAAADQPKPASVPELADEATGLPIQPAIPPEPAARIPAEGYWFATHTQHGSREQGPNVLFIYRLRPTGLEVVRRVPASWADDLTWLDARTLVTIEVTADASVVVRRYVDGAPAPDVTIPEAAWKVPAALRSAKRTEVHSPDTSMLVTRAHQLWLRRCVAARRDADRCETWSYLRIDEPGGAPTTRAPKGVFDPEVHPKPVAKAPAGYRIKRASVDAPIVSRAGVTRGRWPGFTCDGPTSHARWPTDDLEYDPSFPIAVDTITWRSADPPIFEISGEATDPLAARFRRGELFRACAPAPIDAIHWLPGGMIAEAAIVSEPGGTYVHARWTLSIGTAAVAVLIGSEGRLAMAPLPGAR